MKKSCFLVVFLSSIIAFPAALAITYGVTPKCHVGALNVVIFNKDVAGCLGEHAPGKMYCLDSRRELGSSLCDDLDIGTMLNQNNSISYSKAPRHAYFEYAVGYCANGHCGAKARGLLFTYDNDGTYTDNCQQIFGNDVRCDHTVTVDSQNHTTLRIVLSKNY